MLSELYVIVVRNRARVVSFLLREVVLGRDGECVLAHLYIYTDLRSWVT